MALGEGKALMQRPHLQVPEGAAVSALRGLTPALWRRLQKPKLRRGDHMWLGDVTAGTGAQSAGSSSRGCKALESLLQAVHWDTPEVRKSSLGEGGPHLSSGSVLGAHFCTPPRRAAGWRDPGRWGIRGHQPALDMTPALQLPGAAPATHARAWAGLRAPGL